VRTILGLGNPGPEYAATRHNVGWRVLDCLAGVEDRSPVPSGQASSSSFLDRVLSLLGRNDAAANGASPWVRGKGRFLEARVSSYLLIKPLTYMNLSGEAALSVQKIHGVATDDMLVVVDDVHLDPGDIRLRRSGSSGGHNGISSLVDSLGTDRIPRLRIGVGSPPGNGELIDFVLGSFGPNEEPVIQQTVEAAARIATAFGEEGYEGAANSYAAWKEQSAGKQQ
jgi:peptidyl-tRNA hydrolase, PTH1 family